MANITDIISGIGTIKPFDLRGWKSPKEREAQQLGIDRQKLENQKIQGDLDKNRREQGTAEKQKAAMEAFLRELNSPDDAEEPPEAPAGIGPSAQGPGGQSADYWKQGGYSGEVVQGATPKPAMAPAAPRAPVDPSAKLQRAIRAASQIDPQTGFALGGKMADFQKQQTSAQEQKLKLAEQQHAFITQGLARVVDEPSYQRFKQSISSFTDVSQFPPQYDPAWVEREKKTGLSVQQQIAEARNGIKDSYDKAEELRKIAKEKREQAEFNANYTPEGKLIEKPAATLAEFRQVYLPGWLAEKGLTPSVKNEKAAYEDWRAEKQALTPDQKNFEQAKREGFKGTFPQWLTEDANRHTAAPKSTLMMIPDGNGGYTSKMVGAGERVPAGAVSPSGMSSLNVPTAATRTMAETAPKVQSLADSVERLVKSQSANLGPLRSRWAEFMAGKVGAPNAEFTKLRTDIGLLQTALMRMHVGARGGQGMMEHFADLINSSKQSPENLLAALGEIREYAKTVAAHGASAEGEKPASGPNAQELRDKYKY